MIVAFMGLTGLMGVLPRHYTELLFERVRQKDFSLRDFLDMFNHRMLSLFYRAWEKYRFPIGYERARSQSDYDPFSGGVFHLIGMGTNGLRGRLRTGDEVLLHYAGLLAQQPRSSTTLAALLADYFNAPVSVQQFLGGWLRLDKHSITRLGRSDGNRLGNAILGSRFWDQQSGFRIQMGPLSFAQFRQLLPSGTAFKPLVDLARFFVGLALNFDIQLILKAGEVPSCALGKPSAEALRLGWSSWLKTKHFCADTGDAILGSHWTRTQSPSL
jgi:type VI secretion system protein ImpH